MTTAAVPVRPASLEREVRPIVAAAPVFDIHTHLYDPAFRSLLLWGIDELLVYHYLVAEAFRWMEIPYDKFWSLTKTEQAGLIWDQLFQQHSPVSEACRGVLTTLHLLGLDVRKRDLPALRRWFARQKLEAHLDRCLALAGVEKLCMTNSPFDELERPLWERNFRRDERFVAGLRVDPLLLDWPAAARQLRRWGYRVAADTSTGRPLSPTLSPSDGERESGGRVSLSPSQRDPGSRGRVRETRLGSSSQGVRRGGGSLSRGTVSEAQRFLRDWARRIRAQYLMVSLPPDFQFPGGDPCSRLIEQVVLPVCSDEGLPFALMLGVKRAVNPVLRLAGDGVGRSGLEALQHLCAGFPGNKFLATVLARENQHELCVLARKFRNLHPFGCWWFTNVPVLTDEITRQRVELLGLSFTPQHSDARVLEQLVYKWCHFRQTLGRVLAEQYAALAATGWTVRPEEIRRDVQALLGGAFEQFRGSPGTRRPDRGQ